MLIHCSRLVKVVVMGFTLSYTYKEKRVVTQLAVDHLPPYAAVCYALLQSGATTEEAQQSWPNTFEGIPEVAKGLGLPDVCFNQTNR